MTRRLLPFAFCLLPFAVSGCGYSLAGRGQFLPEYIRIVGVPPCVNQGSSIFNIDNVLTEQLQREFASHGNYRTEPGTTGVDAVLTCAIKSSTFSPTAFTQGNQASRYAFIITAAIDFKDMKADKILWSNPSLQVSEEYDVTTGGQQANDPTAFFGQDQNALQRMARTFARTVVTSVLEAF
jgi:hypothetical protein